MLEGGRVCAASSLMVLIYYYSQSVGVEWDGVGERGLWEKGGKEGGVGEG